MDNAGKYDYRHTNSSQSDTPPSKIPDSCKTNLYINSIKVLTYGRHRCMVCKYKGLIRQSIVHIH